MTLSATTNWIDALVVQTAPSVLVTVAMVEGSTPRETGAKMLVTADGQFDTIGGGHLELRACETARAMLASSDDSIMTRRLERFALGPSLGQCCGGVMHLAFERIETAVLREFEYMRARMHKGQDSWRLTPLESDGTSSVHDHDGHCLSGRPQTVLFDPARPCHVVRDASGLRWLIDPCLAHRSHLVLFGAGHVGAAIVRALADLPCHVTWVDERDAMFPHTLPANVTVEATDTPEAVVGAAPPRSSFLVMTHNHALDLRLSESILQRTDMGWFGLIGSITKRMQFEHRLLQRGISQERLAGMICPIGLTDIHGKEPAVIAASVAAQLLQVWEAAALSNPGIAVTSSIEKI